MSKRKTIGCKRLPDKPSKLITIALADLAKMEKSKKYEVNMLEWHMPYMTWDGDKNVRKCEVCFAGSVMAGTCKVPIKDNVAPADFSKTTRAKLAALNEFRTGDVASGLWSMFAERRGKYAQRMRDVAQSISSSYPVVNYSYNAAIWRKNMEDMVKWLKGKGL